MQMSLQTIVLTEATVKLKSIWPWHVGKD